MATEVKDLQLKDLRTHFNHTLIQIFGFSAKNARSSAELNEVELRLRGGNYSEGNRSMI